jgi:nucleotide-binding universal stress UspA family protein
MPTVQPTVRIALSKILLATDFSEVSKAALPFARQLAQWYEGKVFVTHVVPSYEPYLSVPLEPVPVDLDLFWKREQEGLSDFAAEGFGDTPHEEILQRGDLWDTLSDVIRRKNIDVVVVGTHGLRGLKKVLIGSVAERIYRHATCPVLTVGPGVADCCGAGWQLKQIVFATDFSATSLRALPYALSLAEENEATLVFLHIVPPTIQDQEYAKRHAEEELGKLMPAEPWYKPEFIVGSGIPPHEILRVARQKSADLIVMGVKTLTGMTNTLHLPWSTAVEVMSGAPCPVLTVR